MGNFSLPEHMIAWCEHQVALGRAASVGTYLAELVAEDRRKLHLLDQRRQAIADARLSGISMQDPDSVLARWLTDKTSPAKERVRTAIHDGRASGTSLASLEGILARSLLSRTAQAA